MAAHDFIAELFRRNGPWNRGLAANERCITRPQLDALLRLIAEDEDGGAVESGGPGVTMWKPAGRDKYVIREDPRGRRHVIERLSNLKPSGAGRLF